MGVIPGGRGNDFARVAGIPTDVSAAVDTLAAGHERSIDVGEIDGKRFLCIASCGFDSDANRIANEARIVRGNLVYAYAALRALASWRPATFRLELNGRGSRGLAATPWRPQTEPHMAAACTPRPGQSSTTASSTSSPRAEMGKLRFLFRLMPKSFKGTHVNEPEVTVERATEVRISADRPFVMFADGDPIATLPVTVRLLPKALRVIVAASG